MDHDHDVDRIRFDGCNKKERYRFFGELASGPGVLGSFKSSLTRNHPSGRLWYETTGCVKKLKV